MDEALLHSGLGPYAQDAIVLAGCRALAATRGLYPLHVPGDDGWRACCEGLGVPQLLCARLRASVVHAQPQDCAADPSNAFTPIAPRGKAAPLAGAAEHLECPVLPDSLMGPAGLVGLQRLLGIRATVYCLGAPASGAPRVLLLEAHPDARTCSDEALQAGSMPTQARQCTCQLVVGITPMQTLSLLCVGSGRYLALMPRNAVGLLQPLHPTAELLAFQFPGGHCAAVPGAEAGTVAGARPGARVCGGAPA